MQEGLKLKYNVYKIEDGSVVNDCFVLRPQKDKAARAALLEYAKSTDNPALAEDIRKWIDSIRKEEQVEEIHIGDEVIDDDNRKAIAVRDTYYIGGDKEAFTLVWYGTHMASKPVAVLKKTGKRFEQIVEFIKQLEKDAE